jgi:hypothetical protein
MVKSTCEVIGLYFLFLILYLIEVTCLKQKVITSGLEWREENVILLWVIRYHEKWAYNKGSGKPESPIANRVLRSAVTDGKSIFDGK